MTENKKLTHWKKLHNPNYLGSWVLQPNEEIVCTITGIESELVTGADGKKEECTVARFEEKHLKPMILNSTNCKTISKLAGSNYIEHWKGLKIQVYSTKVSAFGEKVDALRIRPQIPNMATTDLDLISQADTIEKLIAVCKELTEKNPGQKQIIIGKFKERKEALENANIH